MQGIYPAWDCQEYGDYPEQSIEEIVFGPTLTEEEIIAMLKSQGQSDDLVGSAAYSNMRRFPVRAVYQAMWSEYRDIANTGAMPLLIEMPYQYRQDAERIFNAVAASYANRNIDDPLTRNSGKPNRTYRVALIRYRTQIHKMQHKINLLRNELDEISYAAQHAYLSMPAENESLDYASSVLAEIMEG